ncbi:MAG: SDR family oxidoreductase [Myxococcota bacterium]
MRYLVTGAAGFIGSHIVEELVRRGEEVVALDDLSTGHMRNLEPLLNQITFIEGDIRDTGACAEACARVDHVIHQAALGSVPRSIDNPQATHEVNATGTLNMLVAARDVGAKSFVFAASSSYFGNTATLPKTDGMPPQPMSPYAVTKATCEMNLKVFRDLYGLNTVGLRYFNIFGPRQDPNGPYAAVIPKFIDILLRGDVPTIDGDGRQTRDFTFVSNVVQANLKATEHAAKARGRTFNVGCGERISINQLYASIAEHLGVHRLAQHGPPRTGDVRDSLADITNVREILGYKPGVNVHDGLRETVAWFVDQRSGSQGG